MNHELELKVQAYVDGQLSRRQAQKVERWAAQDPQAQALVAELRVAKSLLTGNDVERLVPESREFYWSKIQRQIERLEQNEASAQPTPLLGWRRYLAPLAGGAFAALLVIGLLAGYFRGDASPQHLVQVEDLSEHFSSFSFRTPADRMFVVWIHERATEAPAQPDFFDDGIIQ
jgi:anti-sigma factor RsiW